MEQRRKYFPGTLRKVVPGLSTLLVFPTLTPIKTKPTKTKLLYEVGESTSQKPGSQAKGLHSFFGKQNNLTELGTFYAKQNIR